MTVSSNYSFNLNRNQILTVAAREAGVVAPGSEPSANDYAVLSDILNVEVKALQAKGVLQGTVERVTAPLTLGDESITLDADTIDVEGIAYVTPTGASPGTSNNQVFPMTREEYMSLSDPATQGVPTRYYVERLATLTIYLYPVPDANQASFTYARVRLLRDMDTGAVTADMPVRWLDALISRVTWRAAKAYQKPLATVQYLQSIADMELKQAMGQDNERGDVWFHVGRTRG
jgi:hypothetical protein